VDNNFDFNFQENKPMDYIKILPGDHIKIDNRVKKLQTCRGVQNDMIDTVLECTYDTIWKNESAVVLGVALEMKCEFLGLGISYPEFDMSYCHSSYKYEKTAQELGIEGFHW
jgi:hypothetical protein